MRRFFQTGWFIAVAGILLSAGCATPPAPRQTLRVADLQTPAARKAAANQFWSRVNVPDLRARGYRRVAIAEFVLEFVRSKIELTADLNELLRQHPEAAQKVSGSVQSVELLYPNEYDFPAPLYKMLCDDLAARGLEVVPASAVTAAAAYQRFETQPPGTLVQVQDAYAGGSDTGRVKTLTLWSTPDLRILRSGGDQGMELIDADLLRELKADVLLRVRVRVGTFSGHATLERGSIVHVCAPDVNGALLANRSLVSDEWVIAESRQVMGGWEARVNLPRYDTALRSMFPAFIAMGFESAESAPKTSAAPR